MRVVAYAVVLRFVIWTGPRVEGLSQNYPPINKNSTTNILMQNNLYLPFISNQISIWKHLLTEVQQRMSVS